jgi:ABC-type Fe3+ transport system permease subunit
MDDPTPGWWYTRLELLVAVLTILCALFLVFTQRWWVDASTELAVVGLGVSGMIFGLAWMIRIFRAGPEGHTSFWRYHDRG